MLNYAFLGTKPWLDDIFSSLSKRKNENWVRFTTKEEFVNENLRDHQIDKVFIPHWSYIIPNDIWENYECIVFHMTDLPYGRGGSPLQNLIVRGHEETIISALLVNEGIDTGKIYLKQPLSLLGTAEEIFIRSANLIEQMIIKIIEESPKPKPQEGTPTLFKRRKQSESSINQLESIEEVFDYIRMLDCEGYPSAFLETEFFKFEFSRASLKADKSIIADVRIIKK